MDRVLRKVFVLAESLKIREVISCAQCESGNAARYPFEILCKLPFRFILHLPRIQPAVFTRTHWDVEKNLENRTIKDFMATNTFQCMYGCPKNGNFNEVVKHEERCASMPEQEEAILAFNPRNTMNSYASVMTSLKCGGCNNTLQGETFMDTTSGETYCGGCPNSANAKQHGHRNLMLQELLTEVPFYCDICTTTQPLERIRQHDPVSCMERKLRKELPHDVGGHAGAPIS